MKRQAPAFPPPWSLRPPSKNIVLAARAIAEGVANEGQQRDFLAWLLKDLCGIGAVSFRPGGPEGERATAFAEGMRFVGVTIANLKFEMTQEHL